MHSRTSPQKGRMLNRCIEVNALIRMGCHTTYVHCATRASPQESPGLKVRKCQLRRVRLSGVLALQVAASICNEVLPKPDPTIRIRTTNDPNVRENEVEKCRL